MSAKVTLTDAERTRVLLAAALRAGYVDMPVLYAAVERIVAAHVEQARAEAWDEGANAAVEPVNTGTRLTLRAVIPFPQNPYREGGPS